MIEMKIFKREKTHKQKLNNELGVFFESKWILKWIAVHFLCSTLDYFVCVYLCFFSNLSPHFSVFIPYVTLNFYSTFIIIIITFFIALLWRHDSTYRITRYREREREKQGTSYLKWASICVLLLPPLLSSPVRRNSTVVFFLT